MGAIAISLSQEDGQYLVNNKLGFNSSVASSISQPDSGYEAWEGTSMATPHVSGVAALLWSSDLNLTNADIRDAMGQTALDLGAVGRDNAYGYGLVQAYDALQSLGGTTPEGEMHVSAIDMWYVKRGPNYTVYTEVTIVDENNNAVSDATVYLTTTLPDGSTASGSGATGGDGTVTLSPGRRERTSPR